MYNAKRAYSQQEHLGLEHIPKERLVQLIFNEILACIDDSVGAIERKDIALKSKRLVKAINLIQEGLVPAVSEHQNLPIAQNMLSIYAFCLEKLQSAHATNSISLLKEARASLEPLRTGWNEMLLQNIPPK